jgi:hypothetical protein
MTNDPSITIAAWLMAYILTCWLLFPVMITFLKFFLAKTHMLYPDFEIGLDNLSTRWKEAPILVPVMIWGILKSILKK